MPNPRTANQVNVTLKNGGIEMNDTISGGPVSFTVRNESDQPHLFEVRGHGLVETFHERIKPGEQKKMEVSLPPGSYVVSCPDDHQNEPGMTAHLEVRDPRRFPEEGAS